MKSLNRKNEDDIFFALVFKIPKQRNYRAKSELPRKHPGPTVQDNLGIFNKLLTSYCSKKSRYQEAKLDTIH